MTPEHDPIEKLHHIEGSLPDPILPSALATELFEKAPDGLIIVEMETSIIRFVNRRAEFLFGYHRTELVGQSINVLVPNDKSEQHERDMRDYALEPRPRPMGMGRMLAGRHRSGRDVFAYIMLSPLSVPEGQFVLATIRPYVGRPTEGEHEFRHG